MKMELDAVDVVSGQLQMDSVRSLPNHPQMNLPDIQPDHTQMNYATVLCSDPYFAECFLKYHSYQFEYVPGFSMQTLPVLFLGDFYNELPDIVCLMDPLGNIFVMSVQHRKSRMYLDHGSCHIGEVYNLFNGGWITIKFLHTNTFKMFVRDRMGRQIMYPFPPKKYGLGDIYFLANNERGS